MATTANALLEAALSYGARGWRVVPLHNVRDDGHCTCSKGKGCTCAGKHPRLEGWHTKATTDEETIIGWWERWPLANVGVQMGRESGLVDFEYDDEEERALFFKLFGNDPPPTAIFQSSRGRHHLFRWRHDLPGDGVHKFGRLAIRIGNNNAGSQSVFPPSFHFSGVRYQWLVHPDECDIAEIPDSVVAMLVNAGGDESLLLPTTEAKPREHWDRILGGVPEGSRNEDMASYIGKLLKEVSDLGNETTLRILFESVKAVNERNQPPLAVRELKQIFTSLLKKEQNRRTTEESREILRDRPEQQIEDSEATTAGMKLVIVNADPPIYELYARQFANADRGCLVLTAEQLTSAKAIRVQALKQAKYPLPKRFAKAWDGTDKEPGLFERLVFNAEEKDAPLEQKRHLVVAERLRQKLAKPRVLEEGQAPDPKGRPCRLPDGSVVFLFTAVWEDMGLGPDKVSRNELSAVLQRLKAEWYDVGKAKYKRLDREALARLDAWLSEPTNAL